MNLDPFSRQIVLPQVGVSGQMQLAQSRATLIGAGGLGCAAAQYLAAAGIGELTIVDPDRVELSNLHRQILHGTDDIGFWKSESVKTALAAQSPQTQVHAICERATDDNLPELIANADIVLDCSDNFPTRFAINRACVTAKKPLVSGAAMRLDGQLGVFMSHIGGPCYRCVFPEVGDSDESCENTGILGPVVGIIGAFQALEAIKVLLGIGDIPFDRLLIFDALNAQWRPFPISKNPECPVCSD